MDYEKLAYYKKIKDKRKYDEVNWDEDELDDETVERTYRNNIIRVHMEDDIVQNSTLAIAKLSDVGLVANNIKNRVRLSPLFAKSRHMASYLTWDLIQAEASYNNHFGNHLDNLSYNPVFYIMDQAYKVNLCGRSELMNESVMAKKRSLPYILAEKVCNS